MLQIAPSTNWVAVKELKFNFHEPDIRIMMCEKVHLSSAYSACCRVLYSLKAVTPELTTAAEGPFVPLKLRGPVFALVAEPYGH